MVPAIVTRKRTRNSESNSFSSHTRPEPQLRMADGTSASEFMRRLCIAAGMGPCPATGLLSKWVCNTDGLWEEVFEAVFQKKKKKKRMQKQQFQKPSNAAVLPLSDCGGPATKWLRSNQGYRLVCDWARTGAWELSTLLI